MEFFEKALEIIEEVSPVIFSFYLMDIVQQFQDQISTYFERQTVGNKSFYSQFKKERFDKILNTMGNLSDRWGGAHASLKRTSVEW